MNEISSNLFDIYGEPVWRDRSNEHYAIVAGNFSKDITEQLIAGACAEFKRHAIALGNVDCICVPGAFEIPMVCARLVALKKHKAVIALGAVIRGETPHFEYVAGECARGIAQLNLHGDTPVIFGVLTTDTAEQANARADPQKKNKGAAAVRAGLEMVSVLKQISELRET